MVSEVLEVGLLAACGVLPPIWGFRAGGEAGALGGF